MHCYDHDFRDLAVLPPYNTLRAQVIRLRDPPQVVTSGIRVRFHFADNTYSIVKSNFWNTSPYRTVQNAQWLFERSADESAACPLRLVPRLQRSGHESSSWHAQSLPGHAPQAPDPMAAPRCQYRASSSSQIISPRRSQAQQWSLHMQSKTEATWTIPTI
jgi:hypothetical protein